LRQTLLFTFCTDTPALCFYSEVDAMVEQ